VSVLSHQYGAPAIALLVSRLTEEQQRDMALASLYGMGVIVRPLSYDKMPLPFYLGKQLFETVKI